MNYRQVVRELAYSLNGKTPKLITVLNSDITVVDSPAFAGIDRLTINVFDNKFKLELKEATGNMLQGLDLPSSPTLVFDGGFIEADGAFYPPTSMSQGGQADCAADLAAAQLTIQQLESDQGVLNQQIADCQTALLRPRPKMRA